MASKIVSFYLNGREVEVMVKPLTTLQYLLREDLGYTAAKTGCKQGGCGSCTVLVNGEPMMSCLLPVEDVEGQQVLTLGVVLVSQPRPRDPRHGDSPWPRAGYLTVTLLARLRGLSGSCPRRRAR